MGVGMDLPGPGKYDNVMVVKKNLKSVEKNQIHSKNLRH